MNSYKQIQAQIARLQREADEARKSETAAVVEKLKKSIARYGLTAADVGLDDGARPAARKRAAGKKATKSAGRKAAGAKSTRPGAGVAKFRDPKSGATWSGFGRIPGWLASVKDREPFRIGAEAAAPETAAPAAAEPQPASKAARKASAKAASKKAVATKQWLRRRRHPPSDRRQRRPRRLARALPPNRPPVLRASRPHLRSHRPRRRTAAGTPHRLRRLRPTLRRPDRPEASQDGLAPRRRQSVALLVLSVAPGLASPLSAQARSGPQASRAVHRPTHKAHAEQATPAAHRRCSARSPTATRRAWARSG